MKTRCDQSIMVIESVISELKNIAAEIPPEVLEGDTVNRQNTSHLASPEGPVFLGQLGVGRYSAQKIACCK